MQWGNPVRIRGWPATVSRVRAASRIAHGRGVVTFGCKVAMPSIPFPSSAPLRGFTRAIAWALLFAASACSRVSDSQPRADAAPTRVVPASATAVDIVTALVGPERIAGFPVQALEYSTLHDERPPFDELPRFEAYLAEPVLALRPDLVVIDPWQAPETTQRLREAGVAVHALPEVSDLEGALAALDGVAHALREPRAGAALANELRARAAALRERAARRPTLRALCYSNFGGAGSSAGSGTTLHAMMELVGLVNLTAERGARGHVGTSFEDLLALDPDVIVVSQPLKMDEGPSGDRGGASERLLRGESSLAGLRAVREARIIALPAWLFATGSHELVRGAEALEAELSRLQQRLDRAPEPVR